MSARRTVLIAMMMQSVPMSLVAIDVVVKKASTEMDTFVEVALNLQEQATACVVYKVHTKYSWHS